MYLAAGHGRCVKILHVIGDTLCQIDPKAPLRPDLSPPGIDDPLDCSQKVESNNVESHAIETAALSIELENRLDLAENSSNASKDETASEVEVYDKILKCLVALNIKC